MIDNEQVESFLRDEVEADEDELEAALDEAETSGRPLFEIAIVRDLADESDLVALASRRLNVEHIELDDVAPNDDVLEMVPSETAVDECVLPVTIEEADGDERLVLAMREPLDFSAMERVGDGIDLDIRPVLAGPVELRRRIGDCYDIAPDTYDEGLLPSEEASRDEVSARETDESGDGGAPADASESAETEQPSSDDPDDDSSIHAADTAEGELEGLARETEAPDDEEPSGLDSLQNRQQRRRSLDGRPGISTNELIGQIVHANGGLSEEALDALKDHAPITILAAGLAASIERGVVTVDELVDALPDD